jgi:hypothetical protein
MAYRLENMIILTYQNIDYKFWKSRPETPKTGIRVVLSAN